jgi:hypothetical protein
MLVRAAPAPTKVSPHAGSVEPMTARRQTHTPEPDTGVLYSYVNMNNIRTGSWTNSQERRQRSPAWSVG